MLQPWGDNLKRLKKQLLNLAIGELAALVTFIFVYRLFDFGKASLLAFSYLIFILLQGSLYWFYRYMLIVIKRKVDSKITNLLKFVRILNIILLIVIGMTVPIVRSGIKDLIIALGIFSFGVIEYINYYWYRLSYGRSGFNIKSLFNTKLKKSSIHKLITK